MRDPLDEHDPYQRPGADLPGKRFTDRAHLATPIAWFTGALYVLVFLGSLAAGIWALIVFGGRGNDAANIFFGFALFLAAVIVVSLTHARQLQRRVYDIGSGLPTKSKRQAGRGD